MFKFNLVDDIENLVGISDIKYAFDTNVTRVGLTVTVGTQTIKFQEGDLVRLSGQTTSTDNGLYSVKTGLWSKFPDVSSTSFLIKNKLNL